jgi:hypothetical protein
VSEARFDRVFLLHTGSVALGFGMVRRIIFRCARLLRSVPRLFWIILLLAFQIFEVAILWPSADVASVAASAGPRLSGAGKAQTLQSQLPLSSIEAMNQKWASAAPHKLPDLNECAGTCQCDKDRSEGHSAVAWAVNQLEHANGAATRVALPWLPDGAGAAVQCVFGDRIVKGQLFSTASGDATAQQQVDASTTHPAATQIRAGVLRRAATLPLGAARRVALCDSAGPRSVAHNVMLSYFPPYHPPHVAFLTAAALSLLHRNPAIENEAHIVAGQVLALTGIATSFRCSILCISQFVSVPYSFRP